MEPVDRRRFLGGALSGVALVAVPSLAAEALPVIYGDGVRDDTEGVHALASGKPFRTIDGFIGYATGGYISGATLCLPKGLAIPLGSHITIERCTLIFPAAPPVSPQAAGIVMMARADSGTRG